jgi:hypothetical protein
MAIGFDDDLGKLPKQQQAIKKRAAELIAEEARTREGIRQGLDDVRAGRTQPLAEAFADIRRDLNLPRE